MEFATARRVHESGDLDEAERRYLALAAARPEDAQILLYLATLRLQQGQLDEALRILKSVVTKAPDSVEAHATLATAFHLVANDESAVSHYETALALDPDRAETYYGLGAALMARSCDEALACFERAVAIDPDYAEAQCAVGAILHLLDKHEEALLAFQKALDIDPDYAEAHRGRAAALQSLRRFAEAEHHYAAAARVVPEHGATWLGLGAVQQERGRHDAALLSYRSAAALAPAEAAARISIGSTLHELGRIEDAFASYQEAAVREPSNLRAHLGLVETEGSGSQSYSLAAISRFEHEQTGLTADEQILRHYILSKALEKTGDRERAYTHLVAGNRLKRQQLDYDEATRLGMLNRIPEIFTPELMHEKNGAGIPSPLPIFIIGMPRSGSTLVEQILASHPQVVGAGERPDFIDAVKLAGCDTAEHPFPEAVPELRSEQTELIAAEYLRTMGNDFGRSARVTDKMLANFCNVGLIHLALPNARIIHVRRDPIDTCLSCFATLFDQVPYSYDLGELGRYYRAYACVMEHWRRTLPPGAMLEISYEVLVRNFAAEVRRVLSYCGLVWDERCLSFHETVRPVQTASKTQVREPLNDRSIGRWRPPLDTLQPLLDALGQL